MSIFCIIINVFTVTFTLKKSQILNGSVFPILSKVRLLLVDSPAQPTENKTHTKWNDIRKAYGSEAAFHLQRITSELLKATKATGNLRKEEKCSQNVFGLSMTVFSNIQNGLKMNQMKVHLL